MRQFTNCVAEPLEPWYKARLFSSSSSKVDAHVPSLPSHRQAPQDGQYGLAREQPQASAFSAEFAYPPFWLETEKRFVSLRVTTRGLRTIEKRGVDVVVADLRAQGIKV